MQVLSFNGLQRPTRSLCCLNVLEIWKTGADKHLELQAFVAKTGLFFEQQEPR